MESRIINFSNSNLVSKANSIIEASYKLGVMEQKIISTIASNINPDDKDFQTYTFSIKEFKELIGSRSKNIYAEVDKVTTKLMQPFLFINAEGKPTRIAWLSKATYNINEGSVTVRFDPDLKPFFLFLNEKFTRYKLGNIIHLRSSYSIRMYELLKSYEGLTERTFTLDDLRKKLGLEDKYPKWINFRQRVLDHAQKELKDKTDITFTYEAIKKGRSVYKVKFKIQSNSKAAGQISEIDINKLGKVLKNDDVIFVESACKKANMLVSKKVIREWLSRHDKEEVVETIESVKQRDYVKNPIGYISTILLAEAPEDVEVEDQDSIEKVIAELKEMFVSKVKRPRIECINRAVVKDDAISLFSQHMSEPEAYKLWSERANDIVEDINKQNEKMVQVRQR